MIYKTKEEKWACLWYWEERLMQWLNTRLQLNILLKSYTVHHTVNSFYRNTLIRWTPICTRHQMLIYAVYMFFRTPTKTDTFDGPDVVRLKRLDSIQYLCNPRSTVTIAMGRGRPSSLQGFDFYPLSIHRYKTRKPSMLTYLAIVTWCSQKVWWTNSDRQNVLLVTVDLKRNLKKNCLNQSFCR